MCRDLWVNVTEEWFLTAPHMKKDHIPFNPEKGVPQCYLSQLRLNSLCFFWVFVFFFLTAFGLRCCVRAFSSCSEQGLLFVVVRGLLIVVASLVAEHGL